MYLSLVKTNAVHFLHHVTCRLFLDLNHQVSVVSTTSILNYSPEDSRCIVLPLQAIKGDYLHSVLNKYRKISVGEGNLSSNMIVTISFVHSLIQVSQAIIVKVIMI